MKCVPVHHGIPAVLHRDEPWLHRHSENGALDLQDFAALVTDPTPELISLTCLQFVENGIKLLT